MPCRATKDGWIMVDLVLFASLAFGQLVNLFQGLLDRVFCILAGQSAVDKVVEHIHDN